MIASIVCLVIFPIIDLIGDGRHHYIIPFPNYVSSQVLHSEPTTVVGVVISLSESIVQI